MITGKRILALLVLSALPFLSIAQCVTPLSTISFDSTLTGSGNAFHTFTFPRFDASLGTLVDVNIRAEITLRYRFQLENKENIAINNYRVRVVRDDEISGSVLQTPITHNYQTTYGPYALAAFDGVTGSGADYITAGPMYVMNHRVVSQTVYNTADFLGTGSISLDYMPSTYSIVFGSVNYNFNGTAEDTVRFTVTYRYCSTWFLPADISSFTANSVNKESVDIRWTTLNERANRNYIIEKSNDGKNFYPVTSLASQTSANATGKYQHNYIPTRNETGKLIFRLRQTEADGTVKYSALRVVELNKKQEPGIVLYPNPSNGIFNVLFHNTKRYDWKVEVLTLSGQRLREFYFTRSLTARINLVNELPKGSYFVRVTNRKNNEQTIHPLIIK
ncbi:MAG TPA: choice-of-anchor E domain-containing protein [Chitinophagaceae bacterium]|nr:choice-of-anchor E domain-containing protein [Chitinophagaceae bacterium]